MACGPAGVGWNGIWYSAAISVGNRPTFYGRQEFGPLEAHLLDFASDLYGRAVIVLMEARLWAQAAFCLVEELVEQLHRDIAATRQWARPAPGQADYEAIELLCRAADHGSLQMVASA